MPPLASLRMLLLGAALCAHLPGCASDRLGPDEVLRDAGAPMDLRMKLPDLVPPVLPDLAAPDVHVVITADNAYAFGWGDTTQVATLSGRPMTRVAGDIFNCPLGVGPEEYDIPAKDAPQSLYLYIIAWADDATTQGVIGQFDRGGQPIYTGQGEWEVCATGLSYDTGAAGGGPTREIVNQEITRCNDGSGDPARTSAGWVNTIGAVTRTAVGNLAVGEDNSSSSGDFPIVCQKDLTGKRGVDPAAHWMWYSPDGKSPFRYQGGVNPTRTFLIFRLPSHVIVIG